MSSKFLNIDKPWLNLLQKNNNIPVVSGKWQRPRPYHQRLCDECKLLGDEYHFLCKRLKALRSKYISRYFWTKSSMNKFIEMLSSENSKTINNLAIFVYFGFEVFANLWEKKLSLSADATYYCIEISSCLLAHTPHILYIFHNIMYLHTGRWAYAEMK